MMEKETTIMQNATNSIPSYLLNAYCIQGPAQPTEQIPQIHNGTPPRIK